MACFNRVLLMGNLTRDPELRWTPGGMAVCGLGLAVNERFVSGDGERQERTTFVDVTAWNRTAENCQKYLRKGSPVFVEGRLRLDEWEDRESGKRRSKLSVTADVVQFLSGGEREPRAAEERAGGGAGRPAQGRYAGDATVAPQGVEADDDIPF